MRNQTPRSSLLLTSAVLLIITVPCSADDDLVLVYFDGDSYENWKVEGEAFGVAPAHGALDGQMAVSGYFGDGLANSFVGGDSSTGTIVSPAFRITHNHLSFLIGGGKIPGKVGIDLLIEGEAVRTATGPESETLEWQSWDVSEFRDQTALLRIYDFAEGGWGHIMVDEIVLSNTPRVTEKPVRIEEYRKSAGYFRERYRPQYHFTPEINWMNDPNGLVFFQGEYHLFYQHNPHGTEWGHMSWGHAVSSDLVHWKHLPIALHEEYGTMIFSGCCVIDWKNTSGFGTGAEPPMVAVYTGHGHDKQTQDLAYSNDRGRTWTKYTGNPVIDLNESDFRDPKVFWHEPTRKWVMVVSLANRKILQFYGSPDLKTWKHLSDFGPAGTKNKPNWECPDLFELPVEGKPGETRWVLEVDIGNGAIAGGSGGEYFIGRFDGETFISDHPLDEVRWVDYGRDFYAPVSFSDIPAGDGRRIWIGWMNNWQTSLVPTKPWRSAMSIPRVLSLREFPDGMRMVQSPVQELETLRVATDAVPLRNLLLESDTSVALDPPLTGQRLEIIVEFSRTFAREFGLRVRKGESQETIIGYDTSTEMLFVDRNNSGDVTFDARFPGRHAAPLPTSDGVVRLHVFVDDSSVEVFGNDGARVLTERIFPDPASIGVELYSTGGETLVGKLRAWKLSSIWHAE